MTVRAIGFFLTKWCNIRIHDMILIFDNNLEIMWHKNYQNYSDMIYFGRKMNEYICVNLYLEIKYNILFFFFF